MCVLACSGTVYIYIDVMRRIRSDDQGDVIKKVHSRASRKVNIGLGGHVNVN